MKFNMSITNNTIHNSKPDSEVFHWSRSKSRTKKLLLIAVSLILIALTSLAYYYWSKPRSAPPVKPIASSYSVPRYELIKSTNSTRSDKLVGEIATKHSLEFEKVYTRVSKIEPVKMSASDVEDANFCLLYADAVGLSSQASQLIYMLNQAQSAGVEINKNAFGVDSKKRADIELQIPKPTYKVVREGESR